MGNVSRNRHAERDAGMIDGGWQLEGVGYVQVGRASHRERRWGAGVNERALTMNSCRWGMGKR